MKTIDLQPGKKVYFSSDNHLGAPTMEHSLPRERKFVAWLDEIKDDAGAIFLIGDLFDFWMEYKTVVPKGFTRTLGKLAELSDAGIPIYFFVGNHDLWMNGWHLTVRSYIPLIPPLWSTWGNLAVSELFKIWMVEERL